MEVRQLELLATMERSDTHAAKCIKLGLDFRTTYPDDYAAYEAANAEYNANEATLATLREQAATEIETEKPIEYETVI